MVSPKVRAWEFFEGRRELVIQVEFAPGAPATEYRCVLPNMIEAPTNGEEALVAMIVSRVAQYG